jgi:hypothetical protein
LKVEALSSGIDMLGLSKLAQGFLTARLKNSDPEVASFPWIAKLFFDGPSPTSTTIR